MSKIFVLPEKRSGCWYYRLYKPYQYMAQFLCPADLEEQWFAQEMEREPILVARFNHVNAIKVLRQFFKFRVVMDLDDDLFDISPYNDGYIGLGTEEVKHGDKWLWKDGMYGFHLEENRKRMNDLREMLKTVDVITVSTPILEAKYPGAYVNYNGIDFDDWKAHSFKKDKFFRVGWTGGSSHYEDWYCIKNQLAEIMRRHEDIKLVIAGNKFDGTLKDIDKNRIEYWPWVDPEAHPYRTATLNLDLAIIPLSETQFNANKSCVKWYEFSATGVPTIASNVKPYSEEMPKEQLFNDLVEKFEEVYRDKKMRNKIAKKQIEWLHKNRDQKQLSKKLLEAIS